MKIKKKKKLKVRHRLENGDVLVKRLFVPLFERLALISSSFNPQKNLLIIN